MNKRKLVIGGSVGAGVLLILVAFTSIVNAQATKTTTQDAISEIQTKKTINEKMLLLQQIKTFTENAGWFPGYYLYALIYYLSQIIATAIFWILLIWANL